MRRDRRKVPDWCRKAKIKMMDTGMTVTDLAARAGLSVSYVSTILNGRMQSQPAVDRIAGILGISNDYYGDVNHENDPLTIFDNY